MKKNSIDVKPVNNKKYVLKCIAEPSYMSHKMFDNNLVAILRRKVPLKVDNPAYIGMCILNKVVMYEFCYDYIKNKNNNKWKLLFTDNDSLM